GQGMLLALAPTARPSVPRNRGEPSLGSRAPANEQFLSQHWEGNPVAKREYMNVKVDADLIRKAKVIAAARHITLSDYVSGALRPLVLSDLTLVAAGLAEAQEPSLSSGPL